MPENNAQQETMPDNVIPFISKDMARKENLNKILLGIVPFTPVQFAGKDAPLAWGRLIGYSLLAYYTYNKMKPLSYACMGAAGVSLATSLTAKMWTKRTEK
jgi:hypothetical protein